MSSLIHDLENNEAILLMYLADELPAEDRAEVDAMLATDAGMRAELEQLREMTATFEGTLVRLDAIEPVSQKRTASLRQVGRAMAQWQVDRLAKSPKAEPSKHVGYSWWVYTASAAAVVAIGLLAWWGFVGDPSPSGQPSRLVNNVRPGRGGNFMPEFTPWASDGEISRWMMGVAPMRGGGNPAAGSDEALDRVEQELVALSDESSNQVTFFGAPHMAVEAGSPNE